MARLICGDEAVLGFDKRAVGSCSDGEPWARVLARFPERLAPHLASDAVPIDFCLSLAPPGYTQFREPADKTPPALGTCKEH